MHRVYPKALCCRSVYNLYIYLSIYMSIYPSIFRSIYVYISVYGYIDM